MRKFRVRLVFYLAEGDDYSTAKDLLTWMARHYEAPEFDVAEQVCAVLIREFPFEVHVDGERWHEVTRTSQDVYFAEVSCKQATLTDDVLESLPDTEDMIEAACWMVHNNEWYLQVGDLEDYDRVESNGGLN